jgi:hypothetical protein
MKRFGSTTERAEGTEFFLAKAFSVRSVRSVVDLKRVPS